MDTKFIGQMVHRYNNSTIMFIISYSSPLSLQIIPPHDRGISDYINTNLVPWSTSWDTTVLTDNPLIFEHYQEIRDSYFSSLLKYCYRRDKNRRSPVTCVYTAMHGVGYPFVKMAFEAFNLPEIVPVTEQVSTLLNSNNNLSDVQYLFNC